MEKWNSRKPSLQQEEQSSAMINREARRLNLKSQITERRQIKMFYH